jgi:hypothetical protein
MEGWTKSEEGRRGGETEVSERRTRRCAERRATYEERGGGTESCRLMVRLLRGKEGGSAHRPRVSEFGSSLLSPSQTLTIHFLRPLLATG